MSLLGLKDTLDRLARASGVPWYLSLSLKARGKNFLTKATTLEILLPMVKSVIMTETCIRDFASSDVVTLS